MTGNKKTRRRHAASATLAPSASVIAFPAENTPAGRAEAAKREDAELAQEILALARHLQAKREARQREHDAKFRVVPLVRQGGAP